MITFNKPEIPCLSLYTRHILNKIIGTFEIAKDFNVYEMVSEAVSHKCILPSQNELIMETYYTLSEFLVVNGFITENKEMVSYTLTSKGIALKNSGTLDKYEKLERKKAYSSFFQWLFSKRPKADNDPAVHFYD